MPDVLSTNSRFSWPSGNEGDLAAYDRLLGQEVIQEHGVFWRCVRPFFYRPLLMFRAYPVNSIVPPPLARWGGFQHAVPAGEPSNSRLNLLLFENRPHYSVRDLDYNRRRQVRIAEGKFEIRPMTDASEFARKAYPVYLSFYERTRYAYGEQRRTRAIFESWADGLFRLPNLVVLGGYQGETLGGVSVSMRIDETLLYLTYFCDSESLRGNLSDLMLHEIRRAAAPCREIRHIYSGTYKGTNANFYLLRGCECIPVPAQLCLNPVSAYIVNHFMPRLRARLVGSDGPANP